jgi:hypothetical protein
MDAIASKGTSARPDLSLIEGFERAVDGIGETFAEREEVALALANELVRRWTARALVAIERGLTDEVVTGGVRYRRHEPGEATYHSLCGPVTVERWSYRQVGVHNGPTIVPTELLIDRIFAEVAHARATRSELPIAIVQDGAPELWNLMSAAYQQRGIVPSVEMIDRYHLDEHLAAALELVAATDGCAAAIRRRWAASLDGSDTAIVRIGRDLDRIYHAVTWNARLPPHLAPYLRRHVRGDKLAELSRHIEYVRNNRGRMKYAGASRRGFPIGSGVTEGACKSMITVRCKRSGQRWREPGLTACLTLRTQHLNERLHPCFTHVQRAYTREVRPA